MNSAACRFALAGTLFFAAFHAFSQDGGFYLSAATMATFTAPHDFEIGPKPKDNAGFAANRIGSGTFDVGLLGFRAAVGYDIIGFRPEVELSYRHIGLADFEYSFFSQNGNKLPDASLEAINDSIVVRSGDLVVLGAMANLWFAIPTDTPLTPHFGGGVGLGFVTLDSRFRARLPDGGSVTRVFPESSASAFAFQAGGGLSYHLGAGLSASFGYRLFGTTETQIPWKERNSPADEILRISTLFHAIELGLSYRF